MHLKDSYQHCGDWGEGEQVGDGWVEVEKGTKGMNGSGKNILKKRGLYNLNSSTSGNALLKKS